MNKQTQNIEKNVTVINLQTNNCLKLGFQHWPKYKGQVVNPWLQTLQGQSVNIIRSFRFSATLIRHIAGLLNLTYATSMGAK